jgi:hypothetical protein
LGHGLVWTEKKENNGEVPNLGFLVEGRISHGILYDTNDFFGEGEQNERHWTRLPRVGRDAQIEGALAYLTAWEMAIYTPFSFCSYCLYVN